MGIFLELCQLIVTLLTIVVLLTIPLLIPGYIIYRLVKHLIHYNAECQDQYARYREAEQEARKLEEELEYMAKEYDWSKEP